MTPFLVELEAPSINGGYRVVVNATSVDKAEAEGRIEAIVLETEEDLDEEDLELVRVVSLEVCEGCGGYRERLKPKGMGAVR